MQNSDLQERENVKSGIGEGRERVQRVQVFVPRTKRTSCCCANGEVSPVLSICSQGQSWGSACCSARRGSVRSTWSRGPQAGPRQFPPRSVFYSSDHSCSTGAHTCADLCPLRPAGREHPPPPRGHASAQTVSWWVCGEGLGFSAGSSSTALRF